MANTDQFNGNNDEPRKRRGAGFYVAGALALMSAGGFGYWTAIKPKPVSEMAAEVAKETGTQSQATQEAKQPEPAAPAATAKVETAPDQPAIQQQAAAPAQPAAAAQPKIEEPASTPAQVAEQPATAQDKTPQEQQVAVAEPAPSIQPEAKSVEAAQGQQQAAAQTIPAPEPAAEVPAVDESGETPSFDTVRVEPNGDTLIAGRAKPGSEVMVKHNGTMIGKTTANSDGAFVLIPDKPLPAGAGSLTLETKMGEKTVASLNAVAVAVKEQAKGEALVAVVTPDKPAEIIQAPSSDDTVAPSKKVVLDSVDYDDQGNIVFSGRSRPGNAVRLYVDNQLAGEVNTGENGKWTFNGQSAIAAGTHTLRADEVDDGGKVVSRVELPFLREEQQKVALAQPEVPAVGTGTKIGSKTGEQAAVPQRIVIQPGNNLWRLSRVVYGKGTRYTVIYEANKDQIRNPDLIYPGQVFAVPVTP